MAKRTRKIVRIDGQPWGRAHPRRGLAYHDDAIAFAQQFPIGSQFSHDSFVAWAVARGLLFPRGSAHLDFLSKRYQLINKLRSASRHPRMITESPVGAAFDIEYLGKNLWKVRAVEEAIMQSDVMRSMELALATKKRNFHHLCQGAALEETPMCKHLAQEIAIEIDHAEEDMRVVRQRLLEKSTRVQELIAQELRKRDRQRSLTFDSGPPAA